MSYTPQADDTQPKPLFKETPVPGRQIAPPEPEEDDLPPEGMGCGVMGCLGLVAVGVALMIVLLSVAAGWTTGRRTAEANATATQASGIVDQLNRIPQDIASGNLGLAERRLRFLSILTPGVEGLPALAGTATAVFLTAQPTATLTPTVTPTPIEATEEATQLVVSTAEGGGFDLGELLVEAQRYVDTGQFADAYELLDVINAVDPTFQATEVNRLITLTLNGQARFLFNTDEPAQGIIWATRAESRGVLEGDVSVELFAAQTFLNAQSSIGLNPQSAIASLHEVVNLGPGRYYNQAVGMLEQQYIALGDAYAQDPAQGFCPAVQYYESAISVSNSGLAVTKRDNAVLMCSQATPTLGAGMTPGTPDPNYTPPAPVGQVAPVGQP